MMASQRKILLPVLISMIIFIASNVSSFLQPVEAARPLEDQDRDWGAMNGYLVLESSLQKGNPKRSEASGCTYVPGKGGRQCSINSKNIAGLGPARPRPTPSHDAVIRLRSDPAQNSVHGSSASAAVTPHVSV